MNSMGIHSLWPTEGVQDLPGIAILRKGLLDFYKQYRSAKEQMRRIHRVLLSSQEVLPDECDEALDVLQDFCNLIVRFDELLNSRSSLPLVGSSRYSVLFHVYRADELSKDLILLLRLFRRTCLEVQPETMQLRRLITKKMEKLIQSVENIEPEGKILLKKVSANKLS